MKITGTLAQLVAAEPMLLAIANRDCWGGWMVYQLAKLAGLVANETKIFKDRRIKFFVEWGEDRPAANDAERREHGDTVREIPHAKKAEFEKQLNALLEQPVEINWEALKSTDLKTLRAAEFIALGPLVELVEPEKPTEDASK